MVLLKIKVNIFTYDSHICLLGNQIHNEFDHRFFLFRIALSDEERKDGKSVIVQFLFAGLLVEMLVLLEKIHEEKSSRPLIAVGERMAGAEFTL